MRFTKIPVKNFLNWGTIYEAEGFINFREKYKVKSIRVVGGRPYMSVKQFVYTLQNGRFGKHPGYDVLLERVIPLGFCDHSAFWKLEDGNVIYTTMPYYHGYNILDECRMIIKACEFPPTIKIRFLSNKYRYRTNGDYFIMFYDESVCKFQDE